MRFSISLALIVSAAIVSTLPYSPLVPRVGGAGIGGGVGGGAGFGGNGQGQAASDPTVYQLPDSTTNGRPSASGNGTSPNSTKPASGTEYEPYVRFIPPSPSATVIYKRNEFLANRAFKFQDLVDRDGMRGADGPRGANGANGAPGLPGTILGVPGIAGPPPAPMGSEPVLSPAPEGFIQTSRH